MDNFSRLLQSKGVTPYKVSKATGVSQSTLSDWKKGKIVPKSSTLKKIADFFGVSVDYLMTGEDAGDKYYINEDTAELAQQLFENHDLRVLFDAAKDATPEDLKTTYDMLMALKRKEMGGDDDPC